MIPPRPAVPEPAHAPIRSSAIAGASYDAETGTLTVSFNSGGTHAHAHVPPGVWASFRQAPSKGKAYHALIKGKYASAPA